MKPISKLRSWPWWIILLVGFGFVVEALGFRSRQEERSTEVAVQEAFETTMDRFETEVQGHPKFLALTEGRSDEEVAQVIRELMIRGYQRMDDESLLRGGAVRLRLLERVEDPETCARLTRLGGADLLNPQIQAFILEMDPNLLDDQLDFATRVFAAELNETPEPVPDPSEEEVLRALTMIGQSISPLEAERLWSTLEDPANASAAEVCWANKTYMRAALKVEGPERHTVARLFSYPTQRAALAGR